MFMKIENIKYLSLSFIIARDHLNQKSINDENYSQISTYLTNIVIEKEKLIIVDFDNISVNHFVASEYSKKTPLYGALQLFLEKNNSINILFLNTFKSVLDIARDEFNKYRNISIIGFNLDESKTFYSFNNIHEDSYIKILQSLIDFSDSSLEIFYKKELFLQLKFSFISNIIKKRILDSGVKEFSLNDISLDDPKKDKHRLKSTPVHVNKYINIKPLLENYETFFEICYWIAEKIKSFGINPKYLVAGSKNALAIASGVNLFIRSDILIIHQVSPITSFSNFSNLDIEIDNNSIFAIMEDFHCMGTELKVLKGILWSRGIDIDNLIYSFPISSTKIYDDLGFHENKIYPLYKLSDSFDYYIFTLTTCPYCNEIPTCYHRKKFKF